ncbi:hypothetical protein EDC04DRAFT_2673936 [Pisolithus marmoratus]|nr:hypothetical protein EDC04DRAFT_2673936 [Pisolithus marmoratus]
MDELAHARAKLARLQSTERTLVEQLVAIRAAIATQRYEINRLVEERRSLINYLPTELLMRIVSFLLTRSGEAPSQFPMQRKNLAGVSRLWRDLILNTPSFWSDIVLTNDSTTKSLLTQLKRSCEYPLDITIQSTSPDNPDTLLDILIPSTSRWRSLSVQGFRGDVLHSIICKLDRLEFPCLEDVSISLAGHSYPRFLLPACSPALRRLNLSRLYWTEDFSTITTTLTTLSLSIAAICDQSPLTGIPTQSLTTLVFTDCDPRHNEDWVLERDSLYFPLLQRLVLDTVNPHRFLDAVVMPKLDHFEYTHHRGSILGARVGPCDMPALSGLLWGVSCNLARQPHTSFLGGYFAL